MNDWLRSEGEVLKRIASNRQTLSNTLDFALSSAFEQSFGQSVHLGINIQRDKLGLCPHQKPGDIDYLIVPFRGREVLATHTIAIEAKIVRPTMTNPDRNANSMGREQVNGLLIDGFPFVGLLHVSVPEPLPLLLHWTVPHLSHRRVASGELLNTGRKFTFDPFPLVCAARQEGRLHALDLPESVAYRSIAMTLSRDREGFSGNTLGDERRGSRNPEASAALIQSVQALLATEPGLFRRIHWYD